MESVTKGQFNSTNFNLTESDGLQYAIGIYRPLIEGSTHDVLNYIKIEVADFYNEYSFDKCTAEQLQDIKHGHNKFYGLEEHFHRYVPDDPNDDYYTWYCPDISDLTLFGNYKQPSFNSLQIQFVLNEDLCTIRSLNTLCEATEDIETYMQSAEFMIISNVQYYKPDAYPGFVESPIFKHSILDFFRWPSSRLVRMQQYEMTELSREDFLGISLSGLTGITEEYFSLKYYDTHTSTKDRRHRLTLDYSLSMDQHNLSRAVYTYFDVLGNVGGLSGVLFSVAAFLNGMFTFNHSDNVLV